MSAPIVQPKDIPDMSLVTIVNFYVELRHYANSGEVPTFPTGFPPFFAAHLTANNHGVQAVVGRWTASFEDTFKKIRTASKLNPLRRRARVSAKEKRAAALQAAKSTFVALAAELRKIS